MLGLFKDHAGEWLQQLKSAQSLEDWKIAAHTLKGAARGIGAAELGELAAKWEHLSALSDQGEAFNALAAAIEVVLTEIAALLADWDTAA